MPTYAYTCTRCGAEAEDFRTMDARFDAPMCGRCMKPMDLDFGSTVRDQRVDCFQPYVEHHFGPRPVEVRSRSQREALCRATGLTYDHMSAPRPQRTPWENRMQEYKERAVADINRGRKVRVPRFTKSEQDGLRIIDPDKGTVS